MDQSHARQTGEQEASSSFSLLSGLYNTKQLVHMHIKNPFYATVRAIYISTTDVCTKNPIRITWLLTYGRKLLIRRFFSFFSTKHCRYFSFFLYKSICFVYSFGEPRLCTSNEYPQHMFSYVEIRKIFPGTLSYLDLWDITTCTYTYYYACWKIMYFDLYGKHKVQNYQWKSSTKDCLLARHKGDTAIVFYSNSFRVLFLCVYCITFRDMRKYCKQSVCQSHPKAINDNR